VVGGFLDDAPFGAGHDVAGLDAVDIGGNSDHTVGIMAGEIGVDAADRDGLGLFLGSSGGTEQRGADAREAVGLDDGHRVSSVIALGGRLLRAIVSKHGCDINLP
jgi:hypothetical protein